MEMGTRKNTSTDQSRKTGARGDPPESEDMRTIERILILYIKIEI
jgi:hypothetical protein